MGFLSRQKQDVKRSGQIHIFDSEDAIQAFRAAHGAGLTMAVPIRNAQGEKIGEGTLTGAYVHGNQLIGTIKWSRDLDALIGDETPIIQVRFNKNGGVRSVVADMESKDFGNDDDEESNQETSNDDDSVESEESADRTKYQPSPSTKKKNMGTAITLNFEDGQSPSSIFDEKISQFDGDAAAMAKSLIRKAGKLQKENDTLRQRVLSDDQVAIPKKDAALIAAVKDLNLTPEQITESFTALAAYRALGDTPDKVKKAIEDGGAATQRLATEERNKQFSEWGENLGYKGNGLKVFKRLAKDMPELAVEGTEETDSYGKKQTVYKVTWKGADGKLITKTQSELEAGDWAPDVPSLRAESTTTDAGDNSANNFTPYRGLLGRKSSDSTQTNQNTNVNGNLQQQQRTVNPAIQGVLSTPGLTGL